MTIVSRVAPFRSLSSLHEQVGRIFEDTLRRSQTDETALANWTPTVDVYETQNELVIKADLPVVNESDLDVRVENNTLTVRGERKFDQTINEDNFLRVERAYGSFTRTFSLPNTVNTEAVHADYRDGVLTVQLPKREESKPKQIRVTVARDEKATK